MCQWLLWATNEFSLVNVNLQRFGMNGQMLCNLGKERFLELAPDFVGDILWEHLEQMIKGEVQNLGGGDPGSRKVCPFTSGCPVLESIASEHPQASQTGR